MCLKISTWFANLIASHLIPHVSINGLFPSYLVKKAPARVARIHKQPGRVKFT